MPRVLIANLGDSPVVIAALVNALNGRGTPVDGVEIFYPHVAGDRWIDRGFQMLKAHLEQHLHIPVVGEGLPFADANTHEDCLTYLSRLCKRLEHHELTGSEVYLGISGGRKHTSALMAVPALFYRCIIGVLHLYDRYELRPGSKVTARALYEQDERRRAQWFNPPAARFSLVELPHGRVSDAPALRRWLTDAGSEQAAPPVAISPSTSAFYRSMFGPAGPQTPIEAEVSDRPLELIAILGDSPMVVTQASTLLSAGGRQITHLRVVYPSQNGAITDDAQRLERVCKRQGLPISIYPADSADLIDRADADLLVQALRRAVAAARAEAPTGEPALLLSGGRKGMAALALYVAQAEAITQAYHSTIPDPAHEEAIIATYRQLKSGLEDDLARHMFLHGADMSQFRLVEVPIVPLTPA